MYYLMIQMLGFLRGDSMIASRAIMVYESNGDAEGKFVTTVFTVPDAKRVEDRLFKRNSIRRVIFKRTCGRVIATINKKREIIA